MIAVPLHFEPFLRPMVWGGRGLETLGKQLQGAEAYGESWELSDHPLHLSVVADGPHRGRSVRALMDQEGPALLGDTVTRYPVFPWLVKFLDCSAPLSVQVHPDAAKSRDLCPSEGPKNEAWLILAAHPGSWVYSGLKHGVGPEDLRHALETKTVADCLHRFTPRPGDCLHLPAGTVHAVGDGVLMAEIQQTSDATFRLYDWDRREAAGNPRKLHLEESLACIDWQRGPVGPLAVSDFDGTSNADQALVRADYFHLDFIRRREPFTIGGKGRMQVLCLLMGEARLQTGMHWRAGQTWLLPADLPPMSVRPDPLVAGMLCSLPDPG